MMLQIVVVYRLFCLRALASVFNVLNPPPISAVCQDEQVRNTKCGEERRRIHRTEEAIPLLQG